MTELKRYEMHVAIAKKAKAMGIYSGDMMTLMIDIGNADRVFNLKLEELLNADDYNFAHDVLGIAGNIDRSAYPVTADNFNFFVPRYAGEYTEN